MDSNVNTVTPYLSKTEVYMTEKSLESNLEEFGTEIDSSMTEFKKQLQGMVENADEPATLEATEKHSQDIKQWSALSSIVFVATGNTIQAIPPGFYDLDRSNIGILFNKQNLSVDDWLVFPDSIMSLILQEISSFWKKSDLFEKYGFLHKRGYMFYGPQGSGKSILVQQILSNLIIQEQGIILNGNTHPNLLVKGIEIVRQIEPHRRVICLFEDIDAIINHYGEEQLLAFLDGESHTNHVLNIATTNYPEKLDPRLVNRPRRFDRVIKIDMPSEIMRRMYLAEKLKIQDSEELDRYVRSTEGFSFAGLAELVISIKCFDKSFEEAVRILKSLMSKKKTSDEFKGNLGFM
jgi:energy-coupling factor transporter ATP-binding protein EcfA2